MPRIHPTLGVFAIALLSGTASAQETPADSTFLTGGCPTTSTTAVDWDAVVTAPERPARLLPASLPGIPEYLRRDRLKARVSIAMVIDTSGRVMPGTIGINSSTDPRLSAWACVVAFQLRYRPATVAGRPVNALSEQPLSYDAFLPPVPPVTLIIPGRRP
jgi:hypothetical protein